MSVHILESLTTCDSDDKSCSLCRGKGESGRRGKRGKGRRGSGGRGGGGRGNSESLPSAQDTPAPTGLGRLLQCVVLCRVWVASPSLVVV